MEGLKALSNEDLIIRLRESVARERVSCAAVLRCLIEFENRRLHEPQACSSLFIYCTRVLGYSEAAAYKRIQAARATRECPAVFEWLESGRIHLSAIAVLAPFLNRGNCLELLAMAEGKTKVELEFLAASLSPRPSSKLRTAIEPLSGEMVRIVFAARRETYEKLERARQILRHKFPFGQIEAVFHQALEDLLDKRDPDRRLERRQGEVHHSREAGGQPTPGSASAASRRIPQRVKDEVWRRDAGRCAYAGLDGRRCEERAFLEYDHVVPYALGGRSDDARNIRLLCRAHNQEASRRLFGPKNLNASGPRLPS